jgi:hypothetical protein
MVYTRSPIFEQTSYATIACSGKKRDVVETNENWKGNEEILPIHATIILDSAVSCPS